MDRRGLQRIAFAVAAATTGFASDARADAVEVTASALNVRTGPSTGDASIGLAQRGQVYPVLARQGDWVQLQFGARAGWSHSGYLRASGAAVHEVTASTLNVRSGADTRFRELGELTRGQRGVPRATQGAWRRIDFAGREAWVHGGYLAPAGAGAPGPVAPTPPPTTTRPRSAAGFIQLAAAGDGFYCYSVAGRRWGKPAMVYGLERIGRRWAQTGRPRMGVGDISLMNGGDISGHASHERGVDADIRPVRTSGESPVTRFQSAYSRTGTRELIRLHQAEFDIVYIFFNDTAISGTTRWPNHDNHFHVRIR
jgi:uncharacterized protein YraI